MNKHQILVKIQSAVEDELQKKFDEFTPEMRIRDDVGLDSMGIVHVSVLLEEDFAEEFEGVDFNEVMDELFEAKTVGDVIELIRKLVSVSN